MMKHLTSRPLTASSFAPFGEVIATPAREHFAINNGNCIRHHALATTDVGGGGGTAIISIFSGQPYALPLTVSMVERHPLGSQAFYPLGDQEWLVIVCEDKNGRPVNPQVFRASASQGINLRRNIWHGVLTPLHKPGDFLVVDRAGPGDNLQEFHFENPDCFVIDR